MNEYLHPIGAMIELTSKCNLNCSHCYNSNDKKISKEIEDGVWINVVENLCEKGIGTILLSGGEPFMRKDLLVNLINIISDYKNIRLHINTNGQSIPVDFVRLLKNISNKIVFQVSIDSAYPDVHDRVRRVEGAWEKAVKSCNILTQMGFELRIAHTVNRLNYENIEEMISLAIFLGADLVGIGAAVPLGRGKEDVDHIILDLGDRKKLHDIINEYKNNYREYINIEETSEGGETYYKNYLNYYQDWLIINAEGNVKLENRLPFLVGSVLDTSLDKLWERVNFFQKSEYVQNKVRQCIMEGTELDSQTCVYL